LLISGGSSNISNLQLVHPCTAPAAREARQALAQAVGREEEEEGSRERCAEEERRPMAAAPLAPKPQAHDAYFASETRELRMQNQLLLHRCLDLNS
jgi:hypothetical protein